MFEQDAIAAHQLAGVAHGFTHTHGAKGFCQRSVLVVHPAGVLHLRKLRDHAGRGGDVAKHAYQQILHKLETPDRPAKLLAGFGVGQRVFVGAARAANRLPRHASTRHAQHGGSVAEGARVFQAVLIVHAAVGKRDQRVLHHPQRDLVFKLLSGKARRAFLDNKSFHLAVGLVARPDDCDVGKGRVADPLLLPIQHPRVALAARGSGQAAGHARAHVWLSQAKRANRFETRHGRQPALLLIFRAAQVDRAHRKAAVHAKKGGNRRINPRHLHGQKAVEQRALAGAAIALVGKPGDIQVANAGDEIEGKGRTHPVVVDDWRDLRFHKFAHPRQDLLIFGAEQAGKLVKIAVAGLG